MSRTERKVRDLIEDDPSMEDAIAVVQTRAGENGGVEWGDVSDELTSGQWGRLIEKGVVVDNADGKFELADPDEVDAALSEDSKTAAKISEDMGTSGDDEIESEGWSQADKAAGVGVVLVMVGYYYTPIRDAVGSSLNLFLGPLDSFLPFYAVVLLVALFTGVYSALLQANLMNTELMERQQEKMQALRERKQAAEERGDEEALDKIQDEQMEMMGDQMAMFKEQFRPMVWVMLFTIPIFLWIYWMVFTGRIAAAENTLVLPMVGEVSWTDGIFGPMQTWIVWYFLCSMGFSQLIRKSIDLQATPTT